jgi:hypothetical protein
MNCLQSRRLLLAAPRERTAEQQRHIAACDGCTRLVHQLADLERSMQETALVPVPEALVHRILLRKRKRPALRYAAAAAFASLSIGLGLMAGEIVETIDFSGTTQAVGPRHPAVGAISEVMEGSSAADAAATDSAYIAHGLKRLGLSLKPGAAVAYHVGTCRIEGVGECEHIALSTPKAYADVMLVPHYPASERVLVADGRMVALMTPAGSGAYIVVADSAKDAKTVEKALVRDDSAKWDRWSRRLGGQSPRG